MINISHPHICLIICKSEDITDDVIKQWLNSVINNSPNGLLTPAQFNKESTTQLTFYKKSEDALEFYVASLSRNLTIQEASKIIKNFNNACSCDFEIRWSQTPMIEHSEKNSNDVDPNNLLEIVSNVAKINHNKWLESQISNGWRFGSEYNLVSKTSPICRDWDSLSDSYKDLEFNRILTLFSVLDQSNLKIVKK